MGAIIEILFIVFVVMAIKKKKNQARDRGIGSYTSQTTVSSGTADSWQPQQNLSNTDGMRNYERYMQTTANSANQAVSAYKNDTVTTGARPANATAQKQAQYKEKQAAYKQKQAAYKEKQMSKEKDKKENQADAKESTTEYLRKKAALDQIEHKKEKMQQQREEKANYGHINYAGRHVDGDSVPGGCRLVTCEYCGADNVISFRDNPHKFNCYFCRESL